MVESQWSTTLRNQTHVNTCHFTGSTQPLKGEHYECFTEKDGGQGWGRLKGLVQASSSDQNLYPIPYHSLCLLSPPTSSVHLGKSQHLLACQVSRIGPGPVKRGGSPANCTLAMSYHFKGKGCRWAAGHQVTLTGAWLWAPRGLTPCSSLWALSSFTRWWFGFSLQPQTSFPSPSQPPRMW